MEEISSGYNSLSKKFTFCTTISPSFHSVLRHLLTSLTNPFLFLNLTFCAFFFSFLKTAALVFLVLLHQGSFFLTTLFLFSLSTRLLFPFTLNYTYFTLFVIFLVLLSLSPPPAPRQRPFIAVCGCCC